MRFFLSFLVFFAFFFFMSGNYDPYHISLGLVSALLVAFISRDLLFSEPNFKKKRRECLGLVCYVPWLLWKIIMANLYVVKLAFHPRMKKLINPHVVKLRTSVEKDISITTLCNSITLTPGTITVLFRDGYLFIHAIDEKVAEGIPYMEKKIRNIFENG